MYGWSAKFVHEKTEVNSAIELRKSHKAPGFDNIVDPESSRKYLSRLAQSEINKIWELGTIPIPLFLRQLERH